MAKTPTDQDRQGFLFGVAAYAMWGLFPLYWPLLEPAGAVEVLAHRVVWSVLTMMVLVVAARRTRYLKALFRQPRTALLLSVAAAIIGLNWGVFIWGVNAGRVVEVSLGYFINPLMTVLLGVLVLGERLRRLQWVAIGIAAAAVVGLSIEYGHPPWLAFALALTFATYGLLKKKVNRGAIEGLTFETIALAPIALVYVMWLEANGNGHFLNYGLGHSLLLASTGLVTAVPLICFGAAATRISMTTIGLLQYLTPTGHFIIGLFVYGEKMTPMKWLGFGMVWVALAIFTVESLQHRGRVQRRRSGVPPL